jgi:hypothetical protein
MGKYPWPEWWDGKPHPDVPFPKFAVVMGDIPKSPEEVIERALEEDAVRNSNPV